MQIDTELRLSYYRELTALKQKHTVKLVQHVENGRIYVLKELEIYDIRVFRHLYEHPLQGVPRIIELIEDDAVLYVVEEYVSGISLQEQISVSAPLQKAVALEYMRQLCSILRPLHQLTPPIVHRDIKPDNIIITPDNRLVLVDFNSAKEIHQSQCQDTVLIGTVGYAAPEQYGFSESRPTADIYALGVLLNEMLTGHLPSQQAYRGKLEPVIKKCLQMDPANRFQNTDALLKAIGTNTCTATRPLDRVRAWLPPGLRSRHLTVVIPAVLWYCIIVALTLSLEVKNTEGATLQINRIICFLIFFTETLWIGNYRSVWTVFPLSRCSNLLLKIMGVVIWGIVLLVALLFILVALCLPLSL